MKIFFLFPGETNAQTFGSDSLFHVKKTTKRKRNLTEKNKDQDI